MPETPKHSLWMAIAERVVSFLFVFAVAFIWVGSTRQKVNQKVGTLETEVQLLKEQAKERDKHITTMDLDGSVATKNFIINYNQEQAKQYDMLKRLSEQVSHLETMNWRLDRLEREERKNNGKTNAP
jgi:hypothetical protein